MSLTRSPSATCSATTSRWIPTPGHTAGATAFLWDSGQHRCLFTGGTLYVSEGDWIAAVLESSDRAAYIESLERIRALEFDVLVPWLATGGQPFHATTDRTDARRRIDAILERLGRGTTIDCVRQVRPRIIMASIK